MELHRQSVDWYHLKITADAEVTAVEASFDGGATWLPGEQTVVGWRWLVAGPDAPDPGTATVVLADLRPDLRGSGGLIKIVRPAGSAINLTG